MEFVSTLPIYKPAIEIGSFMGRSTICIAEGLTRRAKEMLYLPAEVIAIDHFKGSEEHQKGNSHEVEEIVKYGTTFLAFKDNIKEYESMIIPIATDSEIVANFWNRDIDFLFIDADHSYDGVLRDFGNWEHFVRVGGHIAIHDVEYTNKAGELIDKFPGVTQFYNEINKDQFVEVFNIGSSLRIVQKRY